MGRIDEIRERMERATPGPWSIARDCVHDVWAGIQGEFIDMEICCDNEANASFVANCRSDIPFLLAENERLTAQVETKTKEAERWKVLRLDADRIREGLMDKEMRLISDIMRLEAELAKYRDAEKGGRLVIWPCSPDKTCYATVQLNCGALDCPKQDENGDCNYDCPNVITEVDPEKVVFANLVRLPPYATHEEAEATLKGSEQHDA